ncbi:MAG: hypothetical protein IJS30_00975 [Bacteroidales bacterium]|nr:hypothetical protein [Bacteroidales bacterium]
MIKRIVSFIVLSAGILAFSGCLDTEQLQNDISDLQRRVKALEEFVARMNNDIEAIRILASADQNGDYITAVTPITVGGDTIGYTIAFVKGDPISVYNGKNGADGHDGEAGHTPIIGVTADADGILYWTLDNDWLFDASGQKIKAAGTDGITPKLKIEGDYWYISTDMGMSWTRLGKARGERCLPESDWDSFFKSVNQDDDHVYFVLADGTVITVSKSSVEADAISIEIPDEIPVVQGNTIRIYWRSILKCFNPYIFNVYAVANPNIGKSYPRYYEVTPNSVGTTDVTVYVKSVAGRVIAKKTFMVRCVPAMQSPTTNISILTVGASAIETGYVVGELNRRLTANDGEGTPQSPQGLGLNNINFVGRKKGNAVHTVNQEATGGWSWKQYSGIGSPAYRFYVNGVNRINLGDTYTQNGVRLSITEINVTDGSGNIRCTYEGGNSIPDSGLLSITSGAGDSTIQYSSFLSESYNPFWNPDKAGGAGLDFIRYANRYCNGSIDVLLSHCGVNDIAYTVKGEETVDDMFSEYVKPFVRAFHADFPKAKFIFSTIPLCSPNGGMGANYGASEFFEYFAIVKEIFKIADAARKMAAEPEFSGFFSVAEVTPSFDSENLYPIANRDVSLRLSTQETLQSNGFHPTKEGSYTVADALFHHINWQFE